MLSRFLINLREVAEPTTSDDTAMQRFSRFSIPNFHVPTSTIDRVVGNLGEPLEFRDHDLDEDQPVAEDECALDVAEEFRAAEARGSEPVCQQWLHRFGH